MTSRRPPSQGIGPTSPGHHGLQLLGHAAHFLQSHTGEPRFPADHRVGREKLIERRMDSGKPLVCRAVKACSVMASSEPAGMLPCHVDENSPRSRSDADRSQLQGVGNSTTVPHTSATRSREPNQGQGPRHVRRRTPDRRFAADRWQVARVLSRWRHPRPARRTPAWPAAHLRRREGRAVEQLP